MESIHVREANSEVLVFIDRNVGDRLHALIEAGKIIAREIIREESHAKTGKHDPINHQSLNGPQIY